jgi:signal recognition particle subunit SRP54
MRMVRTARLEADVNVEVAKSFCDDVQKKAIGAEVIKTLKPDQLMVKTVRDELVRLMDPAYPRFEHLGGGL